MAPSITFRFDSLFHEYTDSQGVVLPHITGMLERTGWVDDRWYTEESSDRGTAVHRLTADYDLKALDVETCVSPYRGWLLGHVAAVGIIQPTWLHIEEPMVHPVWRFGGKPDRVGLVFNTKAVCEIKSGAREKAHGIQTALQAILAAPDLNLPATAVQRFALYLADDGRFSLVEFPDRRDFTEAERIIRVCCDV